MPKVRVSYGEERREDEKRRRGKCVEAGEGFRTGIVGLECSSPARVVVHRLLAVVRKCRRGKRAAMEERDCSPKRREKVDASVEDVRRDLPGRVSETRRSNDVTECQRQEMVFNLALGAGLLSLIAASKTELDKTIELRKQTEALLVSFKEEHQSNNTPPKPSDAEIAYDAISTVNGLSTAGPCSAEENAPSFNQPESGITFVCDKDGDMHERERFLERMDHLEEELAAELELLQLHIETEESSGNREATEKSSIDTKRASESSGEVIDAQGNDDERRYCGVPPLELQRWLHELLQGRQEERIKELEAHLECLKKRLHEKEAEITWWKDTAKLISERVPQSSRVLR